MFCDETRSHNIDRLIINRNMLRNIANPAVLNVAIQGQLVCGDINCNDNGILALFSKCARPSATYVVNYRPWPTVRTDDVRIPVPNRGVIVIKSLGDSLRQSSVLFDDSHIERTKPSS